MWFISHFYSHVKNQKGATAIVVALTIFFLVGLAALAVDIGYVAVTRNELQNVVDAAALAGARELGHEYEGLPYPQQQLLTADAAAIIGAAKAVALENAAGGEHIIVNDADVIIGDWDPATKTVSPTLSHPDAVKVTAFRDSSVNGPIQTFFARIFGINTVPVSATATAALTGESTAEPGSVIPIGISKEWFNRELQDGYCGKVIQFYPTSPDSCAGWDTYTRWPPSESYLRKSILEGWLDGSFPSPDAEDYNVGDAFAFIGGTLGNQTFTAFQNLFDYMKTRDDDGDDTMWTTKVVVYDGGCGNPNQLMTVAGFATAKITAVGTPPNQIVTAAVICDNVAPGHGSGGQYGTSGSIPGLVQ
jgi:hypothetical protein